MYEIESKAHVLQRENVIQKLNSFATYGGKSEKKDIYYRIPTEFSPESYVSVRFRTEVIFSQDKTEKITYFTFFASCPFNISNELRFVNKKNYFFL